MQFDEEVVPERALLYSAKAIGLLEELKGEEFRIHPNIVNKAIDSCNRL